MTAPASADLPRSVWSPRLFWGFQLVFWLLGALWLMVQLTTLEPAKSVGAIVAGRIVTGLLLTILLHRIYQTPFMRRQNQPRKWLLVIALAVVMSLVSVVIWMGLIDHFGFHEVQSSNPFLEITVTRFLALIIWNSTYFCLELLQTSHAMQLDAAQAKIAARAGELKRLQDQLNPHFLFNALNIVKASTANPRLAAEAIQTLADYLRFSLQESRPLEPLSRELDSLELYLRLQHIRFQDDLDCLIEVTPDAMNAMVPPMLVQPLLENAFKFGARTSAMPLRIQVHATRDDAGLTITVTNSGRWIPPATDVNAVHAQADTGTSTGLGLANLRRRLALLLGERATLTTSEAEGRVTARLRILLDPVASAPGQGG